MKIILCDNHNRGRLLRRKASAGRLYDTKALTLPAALKEVSDDRIALSLSLRHKLAARQAEFPLYRGMFSYPSFIDELIDFAEKCALYDIPASALPEDNPRYKELKEMIALISLEDLAAKRNRLNRDERLTELMREDVEVGDCFLAEPYHYRILEKIKKTRPAESAVPDPEAFLRRALTKRQEIEACAQDIVRNGESCTVVLCDPASQLKAVEAIFAKYGIPFSLTCGRRDVRLPGCFRHLVKLAVKKDVPSFLACAETASFTSDCPPEGVLYMRRMLTELSQLDDIGAFPEELRGFLGAARDETASLLEAKDGYGAVNGAYEILRRHPLSEKEDELKSALKIRNVLEEAAGTVSSFDDALFLGEALRKSEISCHSDLTDFCTVTDLSKPVPPAPNVYVLGATDDHFPGYKSAGGLFDETYLAKVAGYPTAFERYDIYMKQLAWIKRSAEKRLIYAAPYYDYTGTKLSVSFEAEKDVSPRSRSDWSPVSLRERPQPAHTLSGQTAGAVFTGPDGKVTGSISTIERWFACPYSYFIAEGLKVKEKEEPTADSAHIGTFAHEVMEKLYQAHTGDIAEAEAGEIRDILEPHEKELAEALPKEKALLKIIFTRLAKALENALTALAAYDRASDFRIAGREQRFAFDITEHVRLRGIIDRLDRYGDQFLVIDYKSSVHALNETKVKAGRQLQLLSYLIAGEYLTGACPAGAWYFSFKQDNIPFPASLVKTAGISFPEADDAAFYTAFLKRRAFKGWRFSEGSDHIDREGNCHTGLKTRYDYEKAKTCVKELYEYFYDALTRGAISLTPKEDACMFCDYRPICRFNGTAEKDRPLIKTALRYGKDDAEDET